MLKRRERVGRYALRLALLGSTIGAAMGVATMADPANPQRAAAPASYWLRYSSQQSDHESNGLLIDGGEIQSEIQIAGPGQLPRGLGWYAISAGPNDPDLAAIGRIIREQRLVGGEVHRQPIRFGMRSKRFMIRMDGQEAVHDADAYAPLPPGLRELEAALVPLWARLDAVPLRTLELRLELVPDHVRAGDDLRLVLNFANRGRFATGLRNPAAFAKGGPDALRVHFYRVERGADGQERHEFAWELDLAGHELLVAERKSLPSTEPLVSVAPSDVLRAWTTLRAPALPAGRYAVQAAYYATSVEAQEREKHNDLVAGDLLADAVSLTVESK